MFVAVEDYPRDVLELEARFSPETACREYLCRLGWPDGFRCPGCGGRKHGGVSLEHLDAYLEEFTFRFNRRKSRRRGKLFLPVPRTGRCRRAGSLQVPGQMCRKAGFLKPQDVGVPGVR